MEELVSVMEDIRELLSKMNDKLDIINSSIQDINGFTGHNLGDVCTKLDEVTDELKEISVNGLYNLCDVCNKLDDIETGISNLDTTISLM